MSEERKHVISHDVGTSSVKTALVTDEGKVIANHTTSYPFQYPNPGWVEQDPEDYWKGVVINTRAIMDQKLTDPETIIGMVFSTQAMGIIPIDSNDKVLHSNITWVDRFEGRPRKENLQRGPGGPR